MVHLVALMIALLTAAPCLASQLDESLGPQDPPYYQKVSARFLSWSSREYLPHPTTQEAKALSLIESQIPHLESWSLALDQDFLWPRFQFGLHFKNKKRGSVHLSVFPDHPGPLREQILKNYPGLSKAQLENLIGFGFETQPFSAFIYLQEKLGPDFSVPNEKIKSPVAIKRIALSPSPSPLSAHLIQLERPANSPFVFSPIVQNWGAWVSEKGVIESHQLEFSRFNIRLLDDSASLDVKKVSSEFLMANLRIRYNSNDDYQILYP